MIATKARRATARLLFQAVVHWQQTIGRAAGEALARELKPVFWVVGGMLGAAVLIAATRPRS